MANAVVYVEHRLIVPIAAKLVGSSVVAGGQQKSTVGFNWFLAASLDMSRSGSVETRIAELFPEDILRYVYDKLSAAETSVQELCRKISKSEVTSADVVSVVGTLSSPGVEGLEYSPFEPPDITLPKTYTVCGETCLIAVLQSEGFGIPVFVPLDSKGTVCYMNSKPVEVIGVLKWSPNYDVAGFAINQIVLASALLLRR